MEILDENLVAEGIFQLLLFLFSMELKICSNCKEAKSAEMFSWWSKSRGIREGSCKGCTKIGRDANREELRARSKKRSEDVRGYCKVQYVGEFRLLYQQVARKMWRNLPEAKEKTTKYQAEYNRANRESRSAKRKERLQVDPLFKLSTSMRSSVCEAFKRACRGVFWKEESTINILGCSFEFFASYIASQFTEGMTLENHGQWHLDHIIPLATAITREDVVRLNHYTNFQPLWAKDNLSKGAKIL